MTSSAAEAAFRRQFETGESTELADALADDVWLAPPTYIKVWRGRGAVSRLLRHASTNLEALVYGQVLRADSSVALTFEAHVGDLRLRGIDVLHFDESGLISGVEIVARPPNAVLALSERMQESLAGDPYFSNRSG